MNASQPGHAMAPTMSIGPRVRKSPFYDATLEAGARSFTVYNHMYMPTAYAGPESEYDALVNGVTLWDVSSERQVELVGKDALALVQFLTPRDISKCPVNRCRYVLLTDAQGGIVNDAVMTRLAEDRFWLSPGDGDVLLWAQGIAAARELDVQVFEPDASPLQLQGPLAPHVGRKLFGDLALELGYYQVAATELEGIPVLLSRTGWSGELGYEIYLLDETRGTELWQRCMAAGAEYDIQPASPNVIRSIEGGILSYCSDITRSDNPYTVGLGRLVDLDKPHDFLGREALRNFATQGVDRALVGVEISGDPIAGNEAFWEIQQEGEKVGHLTRVAFSPRLQRNIGLANVPGDSREPGTRLTLCCPDGPREAQVVALPWFQSETKMPKLQT